MATRSAQAGKPGTRVHSKHLGGGLQKAVVQVNLLPTILPFIKQLWLQVLILGKMPASSSKIALTEGINH